VLDQKKVSMKNLNAIGVTADPGVVAVCVHYRRKVDARIMARPGRNEVHEQETGKAGKGGGAHEGLRRARATAPDSREHLLQCTRRPKAPRSRGERDGRESPNVSCKPGCECEHKLRKGLRGVRMRGVNVILV
jgi:hypothetical protein